MSKYPAGWKRNISDRVKKSAELRRCEVCDRKAAMSPMCFDEESGVVYRKCRWCGFVKEFSKPD